MSETTDAHSKYIPPPQGFDSWLDWLVLLPDIDLAITAHRAVHPESAPQRWQIEEAAKASLANMREGMLCLYRDRDAALVERNRANIELAALRQRCADAEMMLRAQNERPQRAWLRRQRDGLWNLAVFHVSDGRYNGEYDEFRMDDDGTGLPLLTAAARSALGQNTEEEEKRGA